MSSNNFPKRIGKSRLGRPKTVPADMVREAAFELFAQHGYENTTVEMIARTCGISRASFFNYFPTKADVLWVEIDDALSDLSARLEEDVKRVSSADNSREMLKEAIRQTAIRLTTIYKPWLFGNLPLLVRADDATVGAMLRIFKFQQIPEQFVRTVGEARGDSEVEIRARSAAFVGGVIAGLTVWQQGGWHGKPLHLHITEALSALEPSPRDLEFARNRQA